MARPITLRDVASAFLRELAEETGAIVRDIVDRKGLRNGKEIEVEAEEEDDDADTAASNAPPTKPSAR